MRHSLFSWTLMVLITVAPLTGFAQIDQVVEDTVRTLLVVPDSDHVQILETNDGSASVGRIVSIGDDEIAFETDLGVLRIPISKIKNIKTVPASSIQKGEIWFPNPNATRLFFAPTGRMLKQGKGYFSDYYLFFPGFAYGLTDRVTLGGGLSIIPGLDLNKQLFYVTPKVGLVQKEFFHLAAGALLVRVPGDDAWDDDSVGVGIMYGVATFGTPDASLTAGLGYGFEGGNLADRPMVVLGGEKRLTRRLALVTENWILPGVENPFISYGFRFFGERMSVDLGLFNIIGASDPCASLWCYG